MVDLIDRESLLDIVGKMPLDWEYGRAVSDIYDIIKTAKPVDAVEVVRCRECEKWHPETGWCDEHSCFINSDGNFCQPYESCNWKMFDADYFCKDGERKDNEYYG